MVDAALDGDFEGTFPFEARYLNAGDVRLHYVDEGPRDAQPLLFVHGNPTWSYLWRRPLAELPAQGRRCVAFDHMGFGRSDKPPQLGRYTLQTHIDNALALIDELDLRDVVLVAHDWGGPIGLGAMLERADRLSRPRAAQHLGLGAAELPAAVRARVPHRGTRRDPRPWAATSSSSRSPAGWPSATPTR